MITGPLVTFGWVSTTSAADKKRLEFAERLRDICEDMQLVERGRQTRLGKMFGVSQQAARKWLDGLTYPEMDTIVAIADWAGVNVNWLLQGVGPKRGNRVDAKVLLLDEAVHSLGPELGADLIDNLRAKLVRVGRLSAEEPKSRYGAMLDAYQHDLETSQKKQQH